VRSRLRCRLEDHTVVEILRLFAGRHAGFGCRPFLAVAWPCCWQTTSCLRCSATSQSQRQHQSRCRSRGRQRSSDGDVTSSEISGSAAQKLMFLGGLTWLELKKLHTCRAQETSYSPLLTKLTTDRQSVGRSSSLFSPKNYSAMSRSFCTIRPASERKGQWAPTPLRYSFVSVILSVLIVTNRQ
jgi:hypothetical protein